MRVNEIFYSIEGEGYFTGVPTVFLRFQGCTIDCDFCDTTKAQSITGGTEMSVDEIVTMINNIFNKTSINRLSITGGNPLTQPYMQIKTIIEELKKDRPVTVNLEDPGVFNETSSPPYAIHDSYNIFDTVSFDIKPPSSLIWRRFNRNEMIYRLASVMAQRLDNCKLYDQVKYVFCDMNDLEWFEDFLRNSKFPMSTMFYLNPANIMGKIIPKKKEIEKAVEIAVNAEYRVRLMYQLHVSLGIA